MRDVDLYRHLLGLESPRTVTRVELSTEAQRVEVWAGHAEGVRWSGVRISPGAPILSAG